MINSTAQVPGAVTAVATDLADALPRPSIPILR